MRTRRCARIKGIAYRLLAPQIPARAPVAQADRMRRTAISSAPFDATIRLERVRRERTMPPSLRSLALAPGARRPPYAPKSADAKEGSRYRIKGDRRQPLQPRETP